MAREKTKSRFSNKYWRRTRIAQRSNTACCSTTVIINHLPSDQKPDTLIGQRPPQIYQRKKKQKKRRLFLCYTLGYFAAKCTSTTSVFGRVQVHSVGDRISYKTHRSVGYRCGNLTELNRTCQVRYEGGTKTLTGNRVLLQGHTRPPPDIGERLADVI